MILMDINADQEKFMSWVKKYKWQELWDIDNINADHWPNIENIAPSLGDVGKIQINQSIYVQTNPCDKWLNLAD